MRTTETSERGARPNDARENGDGSVSPSSCGAGAPRRMLQPVLELGQGGPAGIGRVDLVLVRLEVQVEPADRTEPGTVRAAEDLVRKRQHEPVAGPARQVEPVLGDVRHRPLLDAAG